ncbi:MAG: hypothetical protein WC742_07315 [Gallionellaceae bacterium]|jgi:hypothetical protein
MKKICKPEYLAKVAKLSKIESERLLSRMSGKLPRRLEKEKLTNEEALAIQLELEDEQLMEWRKVMQEVREKEHAKALVKAQHAEKAAAAAKKEAASAKPQPVKKSKSELKQQVNIKDIAPAEPKVSGEPKAKKVK